MPTSEESFDLLTSELEDARNEIKTDDYSMSIGELFVVVKENWPRYKRQAHALPPLYLVVSHRYVDEACAGCNIQQYTV